MSEERDAVAVSQMWRNMKIVKTCPRIHKRVAHFFVYIVFDTNINVISKLDVLANLRPFCLVVLPTWQSDERQFGSVATWSSGIT